MPPTQLDFSPALATSMTDDLLGQLQAQARSTNIAVRQ